MKNIFYMTLMICTLFFLLSCSKKEESSDAPASQTMTDSTGASVSLDGTYKTACTINSIDNSSSTNTLVISNTSTTTLWKSFSDKLCATEEFDWSGTNSFAVGSSATASTGEAVTKITLTTVSAAATLYTDALVTTYNASGVGYGYTDWVKGTAKSIIGLNWDGTDNSTEAAGKVFYDIWYISGSTFKWGTADDGDYSHYPTELGSQVFTKQ